MQIYYRQQSTTNYPILFQVTLSIDHITGATGKTLTLVASKNGGTMNVTPSGAVAELGNGVYSWAGNATDRGTLGTLIVYITGSGCDPVVIAVEVVGYDPFDAVHLGLSAIPNASAGASGGLPTLDSNLSVAANLKYILGTLLTETSGQIAAAFKKLLDVSSPVLTAQSVNQTGDAYARIGTAGAGLTALGDTRIANLDATVSSRTKPADTQAAVTLVTTTTNLTNPPPDSSGVTTLLSRIASALTITTGKVDVNDKTGFSLSSAGVQAIWDAATSALVTAGSIGKRLVDFVTTLVYSTAPTASQNAIAVVDQTLSGHTTNGTVGGALNTAASAGDPWATDIATGGYTGSEAGKYLADIHAQAALITVDGVTYTNPVNPLTDDITIVRGDDYKLVDGRQLQWSNSSWSTLSLTTATITLRMKTRYSTTVISVTATASSATVVYAELTTTQTSALATGSPVYNYDLQAVLASGDIVTLAQAQVNVLEDVR